MRIEERQLAAILNLLVEARESVCKQRHHCETDLEYHLLKVLIEKIDKVLKGD